MIAFLARNHRIPDPPPLVQHAPQPPAPAPSDAPGVPAAGRHEAPDPLTGDIEITETAVIGRILGRQSPVHAGSLLPRRQPGAHWPPVPLPLAQDVRTGPRRPVALTGRPVPPSAYPDPHHDPGPACYARRMRIVSALTGTTSTYENPQAWAARELTPGGAA